MSTPYSGDAPPETRASNSQTEIEPVGMFAQVKALTRKDLWQRYSDVPWTRNYFLYYLIWTAFAIIMFCFVSDVFSTGQILTPIGKFGRVKLEDVQHKSPVNLAMSKEGSKNLKKLAEFEERTYIFNGQKKNETHYYLVLDETDPPAHGEMYTSGKSNVVWVQFKDQFDPGLYGQWNPEADYSNEKSLIFGSGAPAKDSINAATSINAKIQSVLEFPTYRLDNKCTVKKLEDENAFGANNVHVQETDNATASITNATLKGLLKAKDIGCLRNNTKQPDDFVQARPFSWDEESYQHQSSSAQFELILFFTLVFFLSYTASNLIHVISTERESGVIQLMKINGLTWFAYWTSQLVSFMIQVLLQGLPVVFGIIICMIQTGQSTANCVLLLFMYLIFIVALAPFTFVIASVWSKSDDGITLVSFFYWICLPMPAFFTSKVYDQFEPLGARFLFNIIPQCNFFFMMRDIIRTKLNVDVFIFAFLNFFLWSGILYYVDSVFSTKKGVATRSPLFCLEKLWKTNERASTVTELSSSEENHLVVKNLTKKWNNGIVAVDNIKLSLERNQVFGLLGFNGAGKTTLINVITGQTAASSGDVFVQGKSVTKDLDTVRQLVNVCPQENLIFEKLTVRQHMQLFGALYGSSEAEILEKTEKMLEILQMPHEIDTEARNLSGGSKRKLNLMIAFAGKAQLLLLDEPTSGVDSDARRVMWKLINEQKKNKLILFTTHQMNEADILCDQIAIMCRGKILVQDSSVGLKKNYGVGYKIILELSSKQNKLLESHVSEIDDQSTIDVNGNLAVCTLSNDKFLVPMLKMLEEKFPHCNISTKCSSLNEVFLKLAHENETILKNAQEQAITEQTLKEMASTVRTRPAAFYQLLIMLAKRFYYSTIYYAPLILLLLACVLGFIIQFGVSRIIVIEGSNGAYSLANSFSKHMLYTEDDQLFGGKYYVDANLWKEGCESKNLESNWYPVVCIQKKQSENYTVTMSPSYQSYLNLIWTSIAANQSAFEITYDTGVVAKSEYKFNFQTYFSNFATCIVLALMIALVLTYVAREMKSRTYEYQLNTGVRPWVFWLSHYIYDFTLIIAVAAFFQWIINEYTGVALSKAVAILSLNIPALVYVMYLFLIWTKDKSGMTQLGKYFLIGGIVWIFVEGFLIANHMNGLEKNDQDKYMEDELFPFFTDNPYKTTNSMFKFFLIMRAINPYTQIVTTFNRALISDGGLEEETCGVWIFMIFFYFLLFHLCLYVNLSCCSSDKVDKEKDNQHPSVKQQKEEVDYLSKLLPRSPRAPKKSGWKLSTSDVEMTAPEAPVVLSHRLSKVFQKAKNSFTAVNNLSFKIESGQCFGLLGKNGAGKSTAINMMTGMLPPTSGNGYIGGNSLVEDYMRIRQDVGLCPQDDIFWNKFTVYNHLYYYAAMNGVPVSEIDSHITTLIEMLGLNSFRDIACGHLSGGNKRKVMLATALTGGSKVLFFDEPTSGVDPVARKRGFSVVEKYKPKRPLLLTTHIMEECEEICDQVGIMVNGDFVIQGTLLDLVQNANAFYQIDLNVKAVEEERSKQIAADASATLKKAFATTECVEENKFLLTYRVYNQDLEKVSELFEIMNAFAEKWGVEFFVSEIDTEQLFLLYTAEQHPDDIAVCT